MTRLKLFGLALLAVLAVSALAAVSASAVVLPDAHGLPGEAGPWHLNATVKGTFLETELGSKLESPKAKILILCKELSSLCEASADFEETKEPKGKLECNTAGDKDGIVLTPIGTEAHLVTIKETPELVVGILFLVADFTILCLKELKEQLKVKVFGKHFLVRLVSKLNTDLTTVEASVKCSGKGVQELKEYLNDSGVVQKVSLKANFGAGEEGACFQVNETVKLEVLEKRLFNILG